MTTLSLQKNVPLGVFLNSICPGLNQLDDNIRFQINVDEDAKSKSVDWPLRATSDVNANVLHQAKLEATYLNIARPCVSMNESRTYVSLPYHILNSFKKSAVSLGKNGNPEGQWQIGANINPLVNDPFKLVHLNPGCLSVILDRDVASADGASVAEGSKPKGPLNKLSANFTKLLKLTSSVRPAEFGLSLLNASHNLKAGVVDRLVNFRQDAYISQLEGAAKLLVSGHVNVLNIVAMDHNGAFLCEKTLNSKQPLIYVDPDRVASLQNGQLANAQPAPQAGQQPAPEDFSVSKEYSRVVEEPILRIQLFRNAIITTLSALNNVYGQQLVIIGLESGEVVIFNLSDLSYQVIDAIYNRTGSVLGDSDGKVSVTSVEVMLGSVSHEEMLVVVGFSNGEVAIFDPSVNIAQQKYQKKVVSQDDHITYFKKFDLSPFHADTALAGHSHSVVVGHFKLSHKPITSITSTLPYSYHAGSPDAAFSTNPLLIAVGSDDGLLKVISLMSTHACSYGVPVVAGQPSAAPGASGTTIVTDIISNYFNDGITCIKFSPDYKFLIISGKSDLIEVFKMTYYNVNGLLNLKPHNLAANMAQTVSGTTTSRRSRSNTLNSMNLGTPASVLPLSIASNPSIGFEMNNIDQTLLAQTPVAGTAGGSTASIIPFLNHNYPPMVKDISIVARLKGHANTIHKIDFVKDGNASMVYKIVLCGFDGKVLIWDFDYKAFPKVKEIHHTHTTLVAHKRVSLAARSNASPSPIPQPRSKQSQQSLLLLMPLSKHARTLSWSVFDELVQKDDNKVMESIMIINSVYKNLFDLRLKKHYLRLGAQPGKYSTVIHPIVSDKLVPSIEIPLLEIDMSYWIGNGKIDGYYLDDNNFWCFAKNGDIFKYSIE